MSLGQRLTLLSKVIRQTNEMMFQGGDVRRSYCFDAFLNASVFLIDRFDFVEITLQIGIEMTKFFGLNVVGVP